MAPQGQHRSRLTLVPGWNGSDRAARLPSNWAALRRMVRHRAGGQCQGQVDGLRCTSPGRECDHIVPGDDHRLENLQWLCTECHRLKTMAERRRPGPSRRLRQAEAHPGMTGR